MPNSLEIKHYVLALINILLLILFGARFILLLNYEFVIYVAVIIVFGLFITISHRSIGYRFDTLVGLTIWSGMHLAGGGIPIGDGRLYDIILLPLSDYDADSPIRSTRPHFWIWCGNVGDA